MTLRPTPHLTAQHAACIRACDDCALACDHCATACLHEEDVEHMARCIALDIDCASLCRLASAFVARQSASTHALCKLCADVCMACSEECGKHSHDHCQACAQACKACAKACREMVMA